MLNDVDSYCCDCEITISNNLQKLNLVLSLFTTFFILDALTSLQALILLLFHQNIHLDFQDLAHLHLNLQLNLLALKL